MCCTMAAPQPAAVVCRDTGGPTEALNFVGTSANSLRADKSAFADCAGMTLPIRRCRALNNTGHTGSCTIDSCCISAAPGKTRRSKIEQRKKKKIAGSGHMWLSFCCDAAKEAEGKEKQTESGSGHQLCTERALMAED